MKIPDDVYEQRCRYCRHHMPAGGNQDVPERWIFQVQHRKDLSCGIFGLARCAEVPGECLTFHPNWIFGICKTCEHNNSFADGYCLSDERPNYRQVFRACEGISFRPDYWRRHVVSTCDAYSPNPYWFDTMRKQAAAGEIPRNFDPETMEATEQFDGVAAEKWEALERRAADAAAEAEQQRRISQPADQITLF
ncbi:MAG: hypothetical protein II779_05330 [Clostridia bacterium]|nr:hypothetical protein [Clostridia bacterium]